jgi:hypothetical protein
MHMCIGSVLSHKRQHQKRQHNVRITSALWMSGRPICWLFAGAAQSGLVEECRQRLEELRNVLAAMSVQDL